MKTVFMFLILILTILLVGCDTSSISELEIRDDEINTEISDLQAQITKLETDLNLMEERLPTRVILNNQLPLIVESPNQTLSVDDLSVEINQMLYTSRINIELFIAGEYSNIFCIIDCEQYFVRVVLYDIEETVVAEENILFSSVLPDTIIEFSEQIIFADILPGDYSVDIKLEQPDQ